MPRKQGPCHILIDGIYCELNSHSSATADSTEPALAPSASLTFPRTSTATVISSTGINPVGWTSGYAPSQRISASYISLVEERTPEEPPTKKAVAMSSFTEVVGKMWTFYLEKKLEASGDYGDMDQGFMKMLSRVPTMSCTWQCLSGSMTFSCSGIRDISAGRLGACLLVTEINRLMKRSASVSRRENMPRLCEYTTR